MHELINNGLKANNPLINNLFDLPEYSQPKKQAVSNEHDEVFEGAAMNMNNGYGFIQFPPNNLFFHYQDVVEGDFNEIHNGDLLEFTIETNDRGQEVAKNVRKIDSADPNRY
jgi:cold shock CspA family protein